jgi:hypothetical protein
VEFLCHLNDGKNRVLLEILPMVVVSHQSISSQCEGEKKKDWSTAGRGAIVAGGAGGGHGVLDRWVVKVRSSR